MSINTIGNIPCRGRTHYFGSMSTAWTPCGCGEREGASVGDKWHVRLTRLGNEADDRHERLGLPPAPVIACRYCDRVVTRADLAEYQLQIWDDECGERVDRFHACSSEACRILADKDVGDARMNCERRALAHLDRAAEQCRDLGRADLDRIERIIGTRLDEHDTDTEDNGCRCTACCREKFRRGEANPAASPLVHSGPLPPERRAPAQLPADLVERARALAAKIMAHDTGGIPIARAPAPEQIPAIRAHLDEISVTEQSLPIVLFKRAERLRAERPDGFDQRAVDAAKAVLLAQVPRRGGR